MLSSKVFAITLGLALGVQAQEPITAVTQSATLQHSELVWSKIEKHIQDIVPGIVCTVGGPAIPKNISVGQIDWAQTIQDAIKIPGIQCGGTIEDDKMSKKAQAAYNDLIGGQVKRRETGFGRRQSADERNAVTSVENSKINQVKSDSQASLWSCQNAPHPDACKQCFVTNVALAVTTITSCGLNALNEMKSASANPPYIILVMTGCAGVGAAGYYSNVSGCHIR